MQPKILEEFMLDNISDEDLNIDNISTTSGCVCIICDQQLSNISEMINHKQQEHCCRLADMLTHFKDEIYMSDINTDDIYDSDDETNEYCTNEEVFILNDYTGGTGVMINTTDVKVHESDKAQPLEGNHLMEKKIVSSHECHRGDIAPVYKNDMSEHICLNQMSRHIM